MNKIILSIETTTDICSVSLFNEKKLLSIKENSDRQHSRLLALFTDEIFKDLNMKIDTLDAIALSIGPGSYTGLRIGLSFAKGIGFSLNKPIIPVDTMESFNYTIQDSHYFIVIHAYKDYFFIQEYKNGQKFKNIIFYTLDSIKEQINIYGYSPKNSKNNIIKIGPSSINIANVAYDNYEQYICNDIKSITPNYIKPIQFKEKNS